MPISYVTTHDMEDWLRKLTIGLVTRNNFRRHIITLFNFARRRGYLPRDRESASNHAAEISIRGSVEQQAMLLHQGYEIVD